MFCEICGKKITSTLYRITLEGSVLIVCKECSVFGENAKPYIPKKTVPKPKEKRGTKETRYKKNLKVIKEPKDKGFDEEYEIVENYSEIIKGIRLKLGLKQEKFAEILNEKTSLIKKIEKGAIEPSLDLARKIERRFNVKIIKEKVQEEVLNSKFSGKEEALTLGEIARIKEKRS